MVKHKSIVIKNIYYMLAYAFHEFSRGEIEDVSSESFEYLDELFAVLILKSTSWQIKRGLYKEYVSQIDNLNTIRGKIDLKGTIRNRTSHSNLVTCEFDELTHNNLFNKVVKTTLLYLLCSKFVSNEKKKELRSILTFFSDIDTIEPTLIRWDTIRFNRHTSSYKLLINLCYLTLSHLIPSDSPGEYHFQSLSETNLNRLFEKFVLNYYSIHHPNLHPAADQIPWVLDSEYDNSIAFLPTMNTDITLSSHGKTLIIDTKFYGHMTQSNFSKHTIHSNNLYQVFTYVKNKDVEQIGNVSGMLLYAKTDELVVPTLDAMFGNNKISVKTLDLNKDFADIQNQLDSIALPLRSTV